MKRLVLVFALLAAVAACTGESRFPTPTGKGTIRAINGVVGSPGIDFRIEERFLGNINYQSGTNGVRFDDFDYFFNFDISLLGETSPTRIASVPLKVDADRDYTFVLSGDLMNPTVTIWEGDERVFDDTDTVFEIRFSHAAATMGDVDVYFAADGTVPAIGEERGSLSVGEILPAMDIEAGDYVLTVTRAGDPLDVLYQSGIATYLQQSALIVSLFDGDEQNTAEFVARGFNALGNLSLPDITALPTIRFIQASFDLANSDVYDDEMLTNLVLSDHAFRDFTGDIQLPIGTTTYTYTTVGDTSAVLFESGIATTAGNHFNFLVIGEPGARFAQTFIPDRRSISTFAKLQPYHAALQNDRLDFYVVDAGVPIDDVLPRVRLTYSLSSATLALDAGSYDIYATVAGDKTIVAGPAQIDVVLGDVVELVIVDTVDPATADFLILPTL
jgi:hypothetical protein